MLGIALLREVAAQKDHKAKTTAGNCPSSNDNSVRLDINILNPQKRFLVSHNVHNRSTSPWDYNITRDSERFPSEIAEARCRYLGCINPEGKEDVSMNSVPIQQEILVLRRESKGCPQSFRLEKVRVTVGCTCVTPIIRHVG
ncbi:Interleukin-17F [Tupaia chinensis]|uniref:Interleukin-17F n=1 Tax=Tupaia chinensis TaxID=246437 RepID=L8Y6C9_TUPCH|nr:Interleukin-17F [Tupaia chinensis]